MPYPAVAELGCFRNKNLIRNGTAFEKSLNDRKCFPVTGPFGCCGKLVSVIVVVRLEENEWAIRD